jgi:hypothetical protein
MNKDKQCRSEAIDVDEDGVCMTQEAPEGSPSPTERHVTINECKCEECDDWERDEHTEKGRCGLEEPLFFIGRSDRTAPGTGEDIAERKRKELSEGRAKCQVFEKKIGEPQWPASL